MKRKNPLVIGNWKLNPINLTEAKKIFNDIRRKGKSLEEVSVVVAPPFLFIPEFAKSIREDGVRLGAQDVFYEEVGPFTGEVSVGMLATFNVDYIIIGHSERRTLGETDGVVNRKVKAVLKKKITPVVCVGERERDDQGIFFSFIAEQIKSLTESLTAKDVVKLVIAYEPIWAIGTGRTATAEDVKEMQIFIVSTLTKLYDRKTAEKVTLLYGGSVKASIAKDLYENGGMNGFLVGGASLNAEEFIKIVKVTI